MAKRAFTAPLTADRCTGNVVLKDGSGAACMHRRVAGTERCWQHRVVYCCPFCDHMPDGATVKLCPTHSCTACQRRYDAGFSGMCPACSNERTRTVRAKETK